jgi:hypothetical protein
MFKRQARRIFSHLCIVTPWIHIIAKRKRRLYDSSLGSDPTSIAKPGADAQSLPPLDFEK